MKKNMAIHRLARLKVNWLLTMANNVWALTASLISVSFLTGFYLSKNDNLVFTAPGIAVGLITYAILLTVKSFWRMVRRPLTPDEAELTRLFEMYLKERLNPEGGKHD